MEFVPTGTASKVRTKVRREVRTKLVRIQVRTKALTVEVNTGVNSPMRVKETLLPVKETPLRARATMLGYISDPLVNSR